jgi:hypothetical protein
MQFAENFTAPDGIGTGWRLPTVEEFEENDWTFRNELKNAKSYVFWTRSMPSDNMYAYAYNIELGEKNPWPRTQSKSVLLVRSLNQPKTITVNTLPGLEILDKDIIGLTYQEAKTIFSSLGSGWRLPTEIEMKLMIPEIKFSNNNYWINEEYKLYSTVHDVTTTNNTVGLKYPVRPVKGAYNPNLQSTNEIEVGDIVEFEPDGGVFSAEKGAKAIVVSIDNSTYDVVWLDELSHTQNNGGYFKESFVKSKKQSLFKTGDFVKSYRSPTKKLEIILLKAFDDGNYKYVVEEDNGFRETYSEYELEPYEEPKQTQTPKISIIQNIETIPQELSTQFYFDKNDGSRNSPTQKAGELKSLYKFTDYEKELLNTYFKGNDGLWYKINVEVGGVWKWRKADPQPQEPQTQNEPTLNTDYASMSQNELQQRVRDIKIAMEVFDEEDEEYKDLETELDLIKLYLEN